MLTIKNFLFIVIVWTIDVTIKESLTVSATDPGAPANYNWRCIHRHRDWHVTEPCVLEWTRSTTAASVNYNLYGTIRRALHSWQRDVYSSLDMAWVDDLLFFGSKTTVTVLEMEDLSSIEVPMPPILPSEKYQEEYQLLFVNLTRHMNSFVYEEVDSFLFHNPCWVPVHEPFFIDKDFVQAHEQPRHGNKPAIDIYKATVNSFNQETIDAEKRSVSGVVDGSSITPDAPGVGKEELRKLLESTPYLQSYQEELHTEDERVEDTLIVNDSSRDASKRSRMFSENDIDNYVLMFQSKEQVEEIHQQQQQYKTSHENRRLAEKHRREHRRLQHATLEERMEHALHQNSFLLFARLPVHNYHATCRTYTALHAHQTPDFCDRSDTKMDRYDLTNIGWSSVLTGTVGRFTHAVEAGRVFVLPIAESFKAIPQAELNLDNLRPYLYSNYRDNHHGMHKENISQIWNWINPLTCDEISIVTNPWACNYISITNCTDSRKSLEALFLLSRATNKTTKRVEEDTEADQLLQTKLLFEHFGRFYKKSLGWTYATPINAFNRPGYDKAYDFSHFHTKGAILMPGATAANSFSLTKTPTESEAKQFPSTKEMRVLFEDAPNMVANDNWYRTIANSFMVRPNYVLRSYILSSLHNIVRVTPHNALLNKADKKSHPSNNNLRRSDQHHNHHNAMSRLLLEEYFTMPQPCLALHVRNGDGPRDSRSQTYPYIDRTLDGHMRSSGKIAAELGIKNIFIATDNASVIEEAVKMYPQYHWYTQRRPIKDFSTELYEMHNEDDIQKELAHILADIKIASSCAGLLGSFDSQFATVILDYSCLANRNNLCMPSVDLRSAHKPSN